MAFLSDQAFRNLAGFDWHEDPVARIAGYELNALFPSVKPTTVERITDRLLDLIYYEPNYQAKNTLLTLLTRSVTTQARMVGGAPGAPFLDKLLVIALEQGHGPFSIRLVRFGLEVMHLGDYAHAGFFNWGVRRVLRQSQDWGLAIHGGDHDHPGYPLGEEMAKLASIAPKMCAMLPEHATLASPSYTEMCGMLAVMPGWDGYIPQKDPKGQPHVDKRLKRWRQEQEALNKAVQVAHYQGIYGLKTILDDVIPRRLPGINADQLFPEKILAPIRRIANENSPDPSLRLLSSLVRQINYELGQPSRSVFYDRGYPLPPAPAPNARRW